MAVPANSNWIAEVAGALDRNVDGEIVTRELKLRAAPCSHELLILRGAVRGADLILDVPDLLRAIARCSEEA